MESQGRRLALVCHSWSSAVWAWVWIRNYLFRRTPDGALDPTEHLYIVRAGKEDASTAGDRWKVGGPLVPDLETALQHYPHTVVKLEGSPRSNISTFLQQHAIDILVVGDQWPQGMLQLSSLSDWVKQHVACPFIIIRREAVVNTRMKIGSTPNMSLNSPQMAAAMGLAGEDKATATETIGRYDSGPTTAEEAGRRIAIAFTSFAQGRALMHVAREQVLTKQDTVYICHVFSQQKQAVPVMQQTMKLMRAVTMHIGGGGGASGDGGARDDAEVTRDNSIEFGAAELEGYNVMLNVTLQGDPKQALASFCETEKIELLILGTRSGGKIRKRLSGGSVSSHLIDHAPCPCLVVPYKFLGLEEGRDTADDELASSPTSPMAWGTGPASPTGRATPADGEAGSGRQSPTAAPAGGRAGSPVAGSIGGGQHSTPSDLVAQLQRQLEERDRTIAGLRRQVHDLQLAAAQRDAAETHDPAKPSTAM